MTPFQLCGIHQVISTLQHHGEVASDAIPGYYSMCERRTSWTCTRYTAYMADELREESICFAFTQFTSWLEKVLS
jgi:hypothetical protein